MNPSVHWRAILTFSKEKNLELNPFLKVPLNIYRSNTSHHAGKDTRRWDNPLFYQKVNPELCNGHRYGHGHIVIMGMILGMFIIALSLLML